MKYPVLKDTLIAVVVAAIANALLAIIAMKVFNISMLVTAAGSPAMAVGPQYMVMGTVINGLIAGLLFGALKKWTKKPVKIFYVISALVMVYTTYNVFAVESDTATAIVLHISHVIAAAILICGITKSVRKAKAMPMATPTASMPGQTM